MPKSCEAVGCSNHNLQQKDKRVSFHKFPNPNTARERRDRWIQIVRKANRDGSRWSPGKHAVLCGEHFVSGKPASFYDHIHPDWVPSIFCHRTRDSVKRRQQRLERYQRNIKKQQVKREQDGPTSRRELFPVNENCNVTDVSTIQCDRNIVGTKNVDNDLATPLTPLHGLNSVDPSTNKCNSCEKLQSEILSLKSSIKELETENQLLRAERDEARESVKKFEGVKLSSSSVKENNTKSQFYTGLSWTTFYTTFLFLTKFISVAPKESMPLIDQFFVTLTKLRLNLPFEFIAYQTGFGETTIREYFWKWVDVIYAKLSFLVKMPDPDAVRSTLPHDFKAKYPRLTMLIDCFEIFIEQPRNFLARAQTYSTYKSHNTIKVFLACSPLGAITFLSSAWGGRVSDVKLVKDSGFFAPGKHMPGDQILADRGFTLQDLAAVYGVNLIIPAFTKGKDQLSAEEVETSRQISNIRIHVERVIGLLKNRYHILSGTLPIVVIKSIKDEQKQVKIASVDRILYACAALVNLGEGIVIKKE